MWVGQAGRQVGKQTGGANGIGAGSQRRHSIPDKAKRALRQGIKLPDLLMGIGRQTLK